MLVYEKKVNDGRHLFGTLEHVPAEADVQLTYKDENGAVITPVANDTYRDNGKGGIFRESDGKAVNVFIGNKCIIGEDTTPVAAQKAPVEKKAAKAEKHVEEKKIEEEPEQVEEEIREEE